MPDLTQSNEDYLEAILELSHNKEPVRSVDIADHLKVSRASVHKAVQLLQEAGLVDHAYYGQINLTDVGHRRAKEILQRHVMLRRFLTDVLELDEATADQDACRMEHAISIKTRDHWLAWLERFLES